MPAPKVHNLKFFYNHFVVMFGANGAVDIALKEVSDRGLPADDKE